MEEIIFPNQIRMYRNIRGIGMQDLAKHLGISLSAVSKIEKGYRRVGSKQLTEIATLFECEPEDLFVDEVNSQPEVLNAWINEQNRRAQINEQSGIKVIGAGFRFLRGQQNLTLAEVAKASNLTLSVYHRIEMGQREISEDEFSHIALALGFKPEDVQSKIYELERSGFLEEIIKIQSDNSKRKVSNRNSYADLPIGRMGIKSLENTRTTLNVYGTVSHDGDILINKNNILSTIICPASVLDPSTAYAVNYCTNRIGCLLPHRSILIVDPAHVVKIGDLALLYTAPTIAKIISVKEDADGNRYGLQVNPKEKIKINPIGNTVLHRISCISIT